MSCINMISYLIMAFQELVAVSDNFLKKMIKNKYVSVLLLTFICIIVILFMFCIFQDGAKANDKELIHKYYTVITVEDGCSLWQYANEFASLGYDSHVEYIQEVQSINHIYNADELITGNTIVLPYYSYEIL